jgi:four helix bundle protein
VAGVRDYRQLEAWKLADAVRTEIHRLTARPEFRHHLRLRTQLQTAAESACANIAEGFSRYRPKDFARFLRIANGSLSETIEHLTSAAALGLVDAADAARITSLARRSRGAATQLIRYLAAAKPPNER